jgi:hypothetical protein
MVTLGHNYLLLNPAFGEFHGRSLMSANLSTQVIQAKDENFFICAIFNGDTYAHDGKIVL